MPGTNFTTNLRLANPSVGDTGWGTTVSNGMIDLVDPAIAGVTSVSVTASNVTLTQVNGGADQSRQMFIVATGTPGVARDVIVPATSKLYFVKNESNATVTFKVSAMNGVAVPAGKSMALRVDPSLSGGADVVVAQDQFMRLDASDNVSFDGGTFVFNDSGADRDARFEGDTDSNLLFLDASTDRVGIGTSSPAAKLDVNGPASVTSFTGSTRLGFTIRGSTSATDYSGIDFSGNSQGVPTARIGVISEVAGSSLVFGTSNNYSSGITNQAMTLDASGNLLVGTANPSSIGGIGVKITPNATAPWIGTVGSDSGSSNGSYYLYSTGAGAYRFYVLYDGTVNATSTTITAISDVRLKENIRDLDSGLLEVMALKPRRFDWKPGKGKDKKNDLGWIAQEFEHVFPEMIHGWMDPAPEGEEPYKAVNADLIPVLVKAIQEQQALITALTARVTALEAG